MGTVAVVATTNIPLAKVTLSITFSVTTISVCKVERNDPLGGWTTIQAGANLPCPGGKVTWDDAEVPLDVPVQYRATQVTPAGADTGLSAIVTVDSQGYTWLKDPAYPSRNVRLDEVTSLAELTYTQRAGVFPIIDRPRPVVVAARRSDWTGALRFTTSTNEQRLGLVDLLTRGQVLLLSTPGEPDAPYGSGDSWGLGNVYCHVGDVVESRLGLVTEPSRAWELPLTRVDRPASLALMPPGMRWADVKAKYATWQALADTGKTWNQLLEDTP